jgi:hypothetical protein
MVLTHVRDVTIWYVGTCVTQGINKSVTSSILYVGAAMISRNVGCPGPGPRIKQTLARAAVGFQALSTARLSSAFVL